MKTTNKTNLKSDILEGSFKEPKLVTNVSDCVLAIALPPDLYENMRSLSPEFRSYATVSMTGSLSKMLPWSKELQRDGFAYRVVRVEHKGQLRCVLVDAKWENLVDQFETVK
jgi:hypothetical protein